MANRRDKFPPNSRIFVGNLASERLTQAECRAFFEPCGKVLEVVILKSFGFVQYDNPESAQAAIRTLQGRVFGGLTLDLSLADNRPRKDPASRKRDRTPRSMSRRSRSRSRSSKSSRGRSRRSRSRSRSRSPSSRHRRRRRRSRSRSRSRSPRHKRSSSSSSSSSYPLQPVVPPPPRYDFSRLVRVIHLHPDQEGYAHAISSMISQQLNVGSDTFLASAELSIPLSLRRAETDGFAFAMLVGRDNERARNARFNVLGRDGRAMVVDVNFVDIVAHVARAAGIVPGAPPVQQAAPPASSVASLLALLQGSQPVQQQPAYTGYAPPPVVPQYHAPVQMPQYSEPQQQQQQQQQQPSALSSLQALLSQLTKK